ncbi:MAG TPA: hypothetical protein VMF06_09020 [Candidatus Limnocylindria bacterium]|jgi:hypothetical protein|nr:hypothetical protein [Candidatus Limnocylindria bacterium]
MISGIKLDTESNLRRRFHRTPWREQVTFRTPLDRLDPFVEIIVSACGSMESGQFAIDQFVFDPRHVGPVVTPFSITLPAEGRCTLVVEGRETVQTLLKAMLADWTDFLFVPKPKPFVIYSDHDEFTTFFAASKSNLNRGETVVSGRFLLD